MLAGAGAVEAGAGPGEVTANASGLDTGVVPAVVLGTASTGKEQEIRTHNSRWGTTPSQSFPSG